MPLSLRIPEPARSAARQSAALPRRPANYLTNAPNSFADANVTAINREPGAEIPVGAWLLPERGRPCPEQDGHPKMKATT